MAQNPQVLSSGCPILTPPHLRQLHVASVLAQASAVSASAAHATSAAASLCRQEHHPAPSLPAPVANAAAAVHSASRQQMIHALRNDCQYMHSIRIVRETLSSVAGVTVLRDAPAIANLDDAHVRVLLSSANL